MSAGDQRPLLVYDGDCGFCAYTVRYAERVTGGAVRFAPYQAVAHAYPGISLTEFARAIQLFLPDGEILTGAAAAYRTLAFAPGYGLWWWLYRRLPGFAALSEWFYDFVARRRPAFHAVCRVLVGRELEPSRFEIVTRLFLHGLGIIYCAAFASLGVQVLGLMGRQGILPVGEFLAYAGELLGARKYHLVPSLFWLWHADAALVLACWTGAALALLVACGVFRTPLLVTLYVLYLSLVAAGEPWMSFQWDALLLECGFLAILLPSGSRLVPWLYRWLVFRFMFLSGAVKLLSNDPSWADWTALYYHFQTQPLPNVLAWYAHHLPGWVHRAGVGATFFIELALPFLIFMPRRLRMMAAWGFVILQLAILLTGNYNFFNLLTLLMCLFLFDDQALRGSVPAAWRARAAAPSQPRTPAAIAVIAALLLAAGAGQMWNRLAPATLPDGLRTLAQTLAPFQVANAYGLFAVMTTRRYEIIVEGSRDGKIWHTYEFRYKPGDVMRRPPWLVPHQPRLDWQMWFAALETYRENMWFVRFCVALLKGSPPVLELLAQDPFAGAPPRYVRADLYEYWFSDAETRRLTGQWWVRERVGVYLPRISLRQTFEREEQSE
ncbi:MAG TPA: lipase maturation factor family protein [Gammaproteobacteria bacterium]|nr:lipase maturation factor family protein [Gammaproteobacteria bacterium]